MNSFASTAAMRESDRPIMRRVRLLPAVLARIRWMNTSSSVGSTSVQRHGSRRNGAIAFSSAARSVPLTCSACAERGDHLDARLAGELARQPVGARPFGLEGDEAAIARSARPPVPRAIRLAVEDVGDVVAALGLVHVVGRDQHGDAARRRARGSRPRNRAAPAGRRRRSARRAAAAWARAASRRPARGAASSRPRAARRAACAGPASPSLSSASSTRSRDAGRGVDAGDEGQVLLDRQVLVEREALGHVAGLALDRAPLRAGSRARAPALRRCRASAARTASAGWSSCPSRWGRGSR